MKIIVILDYLEVKLIGFLNLIDFFFVKEDVYIGIVLGIGYDV